MKMGVARTAPKSKSEYIFLKHLLRALLPLHQCSSQNVQDNMYENGRCKDCTRQRAAKEEKEAVDFERWKYF